MEDQASLISAYLLPARDRPVRLAIVGRDPFPRGATGIPFCKPSWLLQQQQNSSGRVVLESLGIDLIRTSSRFSKPADLFVHLREFGIVFLNASYTPLKGPLRKGEHLETLLKGYKVNKPFLDRAEAVLLCGQASCMRWIAEIDRASMIPVPHPDVRNRVSGHKSVSQEWSKWWEYGSLANHFNLNLNT